MNLPTKSIIPKILNTKFALLDISQQVAESSPSLDSSRTNLIGRQNESVTPSISEFGGERVLVFAMVEGVSFDEP